MSPPADPAVAPKPRRRRWLWLLLLLFVLLIPLLPLLFSAVHSWWLQYQLATLLAELDRTEPGWRFEAQLASLPQLPDAENAALVIARAQSKCPKRWPTDALLEGNALADEPENPQHRLRPYAVEVLTAQMTAVAEVEKDLAKLSTLRLGVPLREWQLNSFRDHQDDLQFTRHAAQIMQYRCLLALEAGRFDVARDQVRGIFVCSHCLDGQPTWIAQLVRLSIRSAARNSLRRLLAQGELPAADLKQLEDLLAADANYDALAVALRGERGWLDRTLAGFQSGELPDFDRAADMIRVVGGGADWKLDTGYDWLDKPINKLYVSISRPKPLEVRLAVLRDATDLVAVLKLPEHERHAKMTTQFQRLRDEQRLASSWLMPPEKFSTSDLRNRAADRAAQVALAAERFRLDHGRWPASEDELIPRYRPTRALDPFTGGPLLWKRLPDGLVIYSIGQDGKDDGGKIDPSYDAQGTWQRAPDDGFRLWDVARRRQPPLRAPLDHYRLEKVLPYLQVPR